MRSRGRALFILSGVVSLSLSFVYYEEKERENGENSKRFLTSLYAHVLFNTRQIIHTEEYYSDRALVISNVSVGRGADDRVEKLPRIAFCVIVSL